MDSIKLDDLDQRIISILRKDAKTPIRSLAASIEVKPSTVHQRIQRLIANNIIECYTLKLNNKAIGENIVAFLFISTQKPLPSAAFDSDVIKESFAVSGEYDLFIKVKCKDLEHLNTLVTDFKNTYAIQSLLTIIATLTIKEEL